MKIKVLHLLFFALLIPGFVWNIGYDIRLSNIIIILLLVHYFFHNKISKNKAFFLLVVLLLFLILQGNVAVYPLIQIVGIGIIVSALYTIINRNDIKEIVRLYLKVAIFISIIALVQEIVAIFLHKDIMFFIKDLFNLRYSQGGYVANVFIRVSSIFPEPAHLGGFLTPACYFALLSVFNKLSTGLKISKFKAMLILIAQIFTFSLLAYVGLVIVLLFIIKELKMKYKLVLVLVFCVLAGSIFSYVKPIRNRVQAVINVRNNPYQNLSVYTLYTNGLVALQTIRNYPLFGTGIGTFESNYKKYILDFVQEDKIMTRQNSKDAASLLIRVISEMGLLGLILLMFIAFNYKVKKYGTDIDYYYINNASLTYIMVYLLRMGNYLFVEFWFFVVLYIVSKKRTL